VGPGLETEMLGLYRSVDNVFPGLHQKVILFLGAKGGEGTSTVVSSLARVASEQLNRKVAVLDADTLHPCQHRRFGVNPVIGWDDVLRGTQPAEKAFYPTNGDRLWVIPVSSARAGTVQVIDAPGMEGFFGALRERFDLVLIDGAPATVFPDSIILSRKTDGVVLVIEAESTRWPVVKTVQQQITNAGGRVIGAVLNKRRYYIPEFVYNRL
jgi:protein-tyrosine kinase